MSFQYLDLSYEHKASFRGDVPLLCALEDFSPKVSELLAFLETGFSLWERMLKWLLLLLLESSPLIDLHFS